MAQENLILSCFSLKSSSLLLPQLHLICNNTPLSSFLPQCCFTNKDVTPLSAFFSTLHGFSPALLSHSSFHLHPLYTTQGQSVRSSLALSKSSLLGESFIIFKMSRRDRKEVCVQPDDNAVFIIIRLVLEVLLSPRG